MKSARQGGIEPALSHASWLYPENLPTLLAKSIGFGRTYLVTMGLCKGICET
jgi:hypothetical protein